jgi:hypothetical protein
MPFDPRAGRGRPRLYCSPRCTRVAGRDRRAGRGRLLPTNQPAPVYRRGLRRVAAGEYVTRDGSVRFVHGWAGANGWVVVRMANGAVPTTSTWPTLRAAREAAKVDA